MAGLAMLFLFAVGTSGLLQSGGFVDSLLEAFLRQANTRRKLMVLTSPLMIITVGLGAALSFAAVLLGTLLAPAYKKMGLESKNLSRTMEDSGTTYDAFWPWGGGGVFAAGALGVATLDYMPFMFFAFFSTAAGIIVALTQFKVATIRTITQMKRKKSPKNLKIQALRSPPSPTSFRSRARSPPVVLPPATHSKSRFTLLFST